METVTNDQRLTDGVKGITGFVDNGKTLPLQTLHQFLEHRCQLSGMRMQIDGGQLGTEIPACIDKRQLLGIADAHRMFGCQTAARSKNCHQVLLKTITFLISLIHQRVVLTSYLKHFAESLGRVEGIVGLNVAGHPMQSNGFQFFIGSFDGQMKYLFHVQVFILVEKSFEQRKGMK